MKSKKDIEENIDNEVNLESAMDGFFGRVRKCAYCHTPTEFDMKAGERFCPKGCFKGDKLLINKKVKP